MLCLCIAGKIGQSSLFLHFAFESMCFQQYFIWMQKQHSNGKLQSKTSPKVGHTCGNFSFQPLWFNPPPAFGWLWKRTLTASIESIKNIELKRTWNRKTYSNCVQSSGIFLLYSDISIPSSCGQMKYFMSLILSHDNFCLKMLNSEIKKNT